MTTTTCSTTEVAVHCAGCRRWLSGVTVPSGNTTVEVRMKCPKCRHHAIYVLDRDGIKRARKIHV